MEDWEEKSRGFPVNTLRLCIDQAGQELKGRAYCRMAREALPFGNCIEMFLSADRLFEGSGYPQSSRTKRSFRERGRPPRYCASPRTYLTEREIRRQQGLCCTVDVIVESRQRAGWQGTVIREGGSPPEPFRSEMELLSLICREAQGRAEGAGAPDGPGSLGEAKGPGNPGRRDA